MPRFRSFVAPVVGLAAAGLVATGALASALPTDWGVYTKALIPLQGGGGASGDISVQVDWRAFKFCYALNTKGVDGVTGAAVTKGGATIVDLKPRTRPNAPPAWDGCADVSQDVAKAIIANPAEYNVTVTTAANPTALSGSLGG